MRRLYNRDPIVGEDGIFTDLLQVLVDAALEGEMDDTLAKNQLDGIPNRRNGKISKKVKSRVGTIEVNTPRDRAGEHEPLLIGKWERELSSGMDEVILSLYSRGQSVEDVRKQLRQLYGVEVSAGTISAVTDRVWGEITLWQQRVLSPCYTVVYLDAIHFKVRDEGKVANKAIYSVYGKTINGKSEVLGLYFGDSEGSRQWGLILEDIKRRGVEDVFFFCIDGLKGFKEVIQEVYPLSEIQRCIVHMVRNSTRYVGYLDKKAVCVDLRKIYVSANRDQAALALEAFGEKWDKKYPEIRKKWETTWDDLMVFMDYSQNIRRMIYTTNPVEALHRAIRMVTKSKGSWPNEKALIKQLYLVVVYNGKGISKKSISWVTIQRELLEHFKHRYEKYDPRE